MQQTIYDFCRAHGMTAAGAAGILGNIEAESAFRPNNVEDRCPVSDSEYTKAVDSGSYQAFVTDAYGYGLCQWTWHTRKRALLEFARNRGVSIADAKMQLNFMLREMHDDYPGLLNMLKTSDDVRECTEAFMRSFENPADQSESAIDYRSGLAQAWYDRYATVAYRFVDVPLRELCEGISGEDILTLQTLLCIKAGYELDMDGIFGEKTKRTLTKWQAANGLEADGICGKLTWSKLIGG